MWLKQIDISALYVHPLWFQCLIMRCVPAVCICASALEQTYEMLTNELVYLFSISRAMYIRWRFVYVKHIIHNCWQRIKLYKSILYYNILWAFSMLDSGRYTLSFLSSDSHSRAPAEMEPTQNENIGKKHKFSFSVFCASP